MFYERRIGSLPEIIKEAEGMDADSGIRMSGQYGGRRCYVFVTRFGTRYTVMIYGRRGGLGKRLLSEEIDGIEGLKSLLKKVASHKVEAFAY